MKKLICVILILMLMLPAGCGKESVSEEDAIRVAEEFVNILLTSDSERFQKHKETDFYVENPTGYETYGYESLFMYLPLYEEICTKNALRNISREDSSCVLLMDRYIDMTEYDRSTVLSLTSQVTDETEELYTVFCTVHVAFWKGDVYTPESTGVEVYVWKKDSPYDEGKAGQIDNVTFPVSFVYVW